MGSKKEGSAEGWQWISHYKLIHCSNSLHSSLEFGTLLASAASVPETASGTDGARVRQAAAATTAAGSRWRQWAAAGSFDMLTCCLLPKSARSADHGRPGAPGKKGRAARAAAALLRALRHLCALDAANAADRRRNAAPCRKAALRARGCRCHRG